MQSEDFKAEGGVPITPEMAMDLRQIVFGSSAAPTRSEWTRTAFTFGAAGEPLAYGLKCPRNATRGLLSVLQGFILKCLLFDRRARTSTYTVDQLLRPNEKQQIEALTLSMAEILKQIAEKNSIFVALPGEEVFVPHSVQYFHDSVTEKLYLFEFESSDDVQFFLKRHLKHFVDELSPAALLFLYSAVLTRSISKTRTDLDGPKGAYLAGNMEEGSLNIVTLLLTGRATPYLHNGVIHVGDEDNYALPRYGVLNRCTIGLLLWENDGRGDSSRQPGSRLKTPNIPIWITSCAGHFGIVFNTNPDLLRNYHAESRFDLFYYSCSGTQISMTIDNRSYNDHAMGMLVRQSSESSVVAAASSGSGGGNDKDEAVSTPLQRLIHTKWQEANIRFHVQSSMLSYLFSTNN